MQKKERKLQRLQGYDYSRDNNYFVTICTHNRENFFGEIKNGKIILNEFGEIVKNKWIDLPNHYFNCFLDEFIVMPNHFHGIVVIDNSGDSSRVRGENGGNGLEPFRTVSSKSALLNNNELEKHNNSDEGIGEIKIHGLSEMIRSFKTFSSKEINLLIKNNIVGKSSQSFINIEKFKWHKSFHDRIIRNDRELNNVRNYIKNNPLKWQIDIENSKQKADDLKNDAYYEKIINFQPSHSLRTEHFQSVPSNNRSQQNNN